jgi:hypothetical protein
MDMKRVVVSRAMCNISTMQVCAVTDATDEEILEVCNSENPAGTRHGWNTVLRKEMCNGSLGREANKAPVNCDDYPGRVHILVLC